MTYDDLDAEVESMERVALLEILWSTEQTSLREICEGLILREKEDSEDQYIWIGYFRSEMATLLDNDPEVEIALL